MTEIKDNVKQLILLSFSLTPETKKLLIEKLPELSEEQITAIKGVLEQEEQKKDEILKQAIERNPEIAKKIEYIIRSNVEKMYKNVESADRAKEKEGLDDILSKMK